MRIGNKILSNLKEDRETLDSKFNQAIILLSDIKKEINNEEIDTKLSNIIVDIFNIQSDVYRDSKLNEDIDIAKDKFIEYSKGKIEKIEPVKIKASMLDFLWNYDDEDFDKNKEYKVRVNYIYEDGTKDLNAVDTIEEFGVEDLVLTSDGKLIYGGEMDAGSLNHLMEFEWKTIDKDFYNDVLENWESWEMSNRYEEESLTEGIKLNEEIDLSTATPEEIDDYNSKELYNKAKNAKTPEEVFKYTCASTASNWMSAISEDIGAGYLDMIVREAMNNYRGIVSYEDKDKYSSEDFKKAIISEFENNRGFKLNIIEESIYESTINE